jgi:rhodanese-related sulfurtransferase
MVMYPFRVVAAAACALLLTDFSSAATQAPPTSASARVLVAMDPADEGAGLLPIMVSSRELSQLLNAPAVILPTLDLRDAMRASRTQENDILVAPTHVTASALAHGYELVAVSGGEERYVLVAEREIANVMALKDRTVYFPLEDSLRTYVGRSLIISGGLPLRAVHVDYAESSVAGLMSLGGQRVQATVAEEAEWKKWDEAHPGKTSVIATSRSLPAGFGVTVKSSASPALKKAALQWVTSTQFIIPGVRRFRVAADPAAYEYVASLGIFTPSELEGVKRITAPQAQELANRGALLVDVRTEREFNSRHAKSAVLLPYTEKSFKEPQFDAAVDSFAGIEKLDKNRPVVFMCNGPECWKSYKASYAARSVGFREVYWLRGGVPEWVKSDLPTEP